MKKKLIGLNDASAKNKSVNFQFNIDGQILPPSSGNFSGNIDGLPQPRVLPSVNISNKKQKKALPPLKVINYNMHGFRMDKWLYILNKAQQDIIFLQETNGIEHINFKNFQKIQKTRPNKTSLTTLVHKKWVVERLLEDETEDAICLRLILNSKQSIYLVNLHQIKKKDQWRYFTTIYANRPAIIAGDLNQSIRNAHQYSYIKEGKEIKQQIRKLDKIQKYNKKLNRVNKQIEERRQSQLPYQELIKRQACYIKNLAESRVDEKQTQTIQDLKERLKFLASNSTIWARNAFQIRQFQVITTGNTRQSSDGKKKSCIDYILVSESLKLLIFYWFWEPFNDLSDHRLCRMEIKIKEDWLPKMPVINKKEFKKKFVDSKGRSKDPLNSIEKYIHHCNSKELEYSPVIFEDYPKVDYNDKIKLLKPKLFSTQSKEFHKFLEHTKDLKPGKKEGSIVQCFKSGRPHFLISGYKEVTHMCIEYLSSIQKINKSRLQNDIALPELQLKDFNNIIQELASCRKATSFDGIEMEVLAAVWQANKEMINLWDSKVLKHFEYSLQMRLVPLNKAYPEIPEINQFRPIMITSHLIKIVEYRFINKFREIVEKKIQPNQAGFVPGIGTQINILAVQEFLKKQMKNKALLFVDLSNAYNQVNRKKVFEVIRNKYYMIINKEECDFLEWLYDNISIYDPITKEQIYWENGVHQGSMLSPFIFNIYMDEVMSEMMKQLEQQGYIYDLRDNTLEVFKPTKNRGQICQKRFYLKILLYADDLVIMTNGETIPIILHEFNNACKNNNLPINLKKTKLMTLQKKVQWTQRMFEEIEVVKSFNYLGVELSIFKSLRKQFERVKKKVLFISNKLKSLSKILPLRHMSQIWNCYIRPHFEYSKNLVNNASENIKRQWELLKTTTLRRVLGFNKHTPGVEMNKLFKTFNWNSQAIKHQIYKSMNRFWCPIDNWSKLQFESDHERELRGSQEEKNKTLLKILPSCWKFKYTMYGRQCFKCSTTNKKIWWHWDHLQSHSQQTRDLYNKFNMLEGEIFQKTEELSNQRKINWSKEKSGLKYKVKILMSKLKRLFE